MKLYVPIPGVLRFQPLFDGDAGEMHDGESEYLQKYLTQDQRTISVWYIEDGIDLKVLNKIMNDNMIPFRIKK